MLFKLDGKLILLSDLASVVELKHLRMEYTSHDTPQALQEALWFIRNISVSKLTIELIGSGQIPLTDKVLILGPVSTLHVLSGKYPLANESPFLCQLLAVKRIKELKLCYFTLTEGFLQQTLSILFQNPLKRLLLSSCEIEDKPTFYNWLEILAKKIQFFSMVNCSPLIEPHDLSLQLHTKLHFSSARQVLSHANPHFFRGLEIASLGSTYLYGLMQHKQFALLRRLSISEVGFDQETEQALRQVIKNDQFTHLALSLATLSHEFMSTFIDCVKSNSGLQVLNLDSAQYDIDDLRQLVLALPKNTHLRKLYVNSVGELEQELSFILFCGNRSLYQIQSINVQATLSERTQNMLTQNEHLYKNLLFSEVLYQRTAYRAYIWRRSLIENALQDRDLGGHSAEILFFKECQSSLESSLLKQEAYLVPSLQGYCGLQLALLYAINPEHAHFTQTLAWTNDNLLAWLPLAPHKKARLKQCAQALLPVKLNQEK